MRLPSIPLGRQRVLEVALAAAASSIPWCLPYEQPALAYDQIPSSPLGMPNSHSRMAKLYTSAETS